MLSDDRGNELEESEDSANRYKLLPSPLQPNTNVVGNATLSMPCSDFVAS